MSRYDIDAVKTAASGRWRDIIQSIAGIGDDYLTTKHGPCPVHGGSTKFRVFNDFDKCGGAVCNDCGKMGDGIALIEKITGKPFIEALSLVANYLNIQPIERKSKKKSEPADRLEIFFDADPTSEELGFGGWCAKKEPITPAALRAVGAKLGRFRWCDDSFSVLAVPVWGPKLNEENPVGWVLYEITHGLLPSGKREEVEWNKVRLSSKCGRGLICDPARYKDSKSILKLEGPPDTLAALTVADIPEDVFPFTTANGSEETPLPWMIDIATGREAIICHDADQPGDRGADKWAGALANKATTSRKVVLPYEIEPKHGKDFRDWLTDDNKGNWDKFLVLTSTEKECVPAQLHLRNYEWGIEIDDSGRERRVMEPIPMPQIRERALEMFSGWPRRIGRQLFVVNDKHESRTLDRASCLFSFWRDKAKVTWGVGESLATKEEIFDDMRFHAEKCDALEFYQHFPKIKGIYYACPEVEECDETYLDLFLDFFSPASEYDRQLCKAAVATVFWGGPCGQRPGILVTGVGMGSGKSKLVNKIASLCGGAFQFTKESKQESMVKEMLSGENARKRVIFIDNPKASLLSSDAIESMITSEQITGHQMFYGHAMRPNYLTWFIAMNAASMSRDMAQRFVTVKLDKPKYSGKWNAEVDRFIESNYLKIIGGVQAFFQRPQKDLDRYNRWGLWQSEILSRLEYSDEISREIGFRESENDSDFKNARDIEEETRTTLVRNGYQYPFSVHVSYETMRTIVSDAVGETASKKWAVSYVNRLIENHVLGFLKKNPSRKNGRGFLFQTDEKIDVNYDLDERIRNAKEKFTEEKIMREESARESVRESNKSGAAF